MFDTPCVSTPRMSALTRTSVASALSSAFTPILRKIAATVSRSGSSRTRTAKSSGTMKCSSILILLLT